MEILCIVFDLSGELHLNRWRPEDEIEEDFDRDVTNAIYLIIDIEP